MVRELSTATATVAAVLVLAACGSSAAARSGGGSSGTTHRSETQATSQPPPQTSTDDASSMELVGVATSQDMRDYLAALRPVSREIARANVAGHREVQLSGSGDFAGMAAASRQVSRHVHRAAVLTERITPPQMLEQPHRDLARSFSVGSRMALRLAVLYEHIGPNSKHDYDTQVVPLEKRTLRLANRWYGPTAHMMKDLHVRMPGWVDHLFDWS